MSWKSLKAHSYVPYSEDQQACIIESESGRFYAGVRIENISFPLTISAIQSACCICLSEGERPAKLYKESSDIQQLKFWVEEFNLEVIQTKKPPVDRLAKLRKSAETNLDPHQKLKELLPHAVIPNSNFPVAALLFVEDGYFEGVNVEVSDWSMGLCAERVAISKAVANGYTEFKSMEIHTEKGEISSPCGACRQVMSELLPYHKIKLHHVDGTLSEHLSIDLLPFSFTSRALRKSE
jgi:homotetrameric cytidine deaminase